MDTSSYCTVLSRREGLETLCEGKERLSKSLTGLREETAKEENTEEFDLLAGIIVYKKENARF